MSGRPPTVLWSAICSARRAMRGGLLPFFGGNTFGLLVPIVI